jgi:hypothetical protein
MSASRIGMISGISALLVSVTLINSSGARGSTLEDHARRLARRVEKGITAAKGKGATGYLADLQVGGLAVESDLRSAFVRSFVRTLRTSTVVDFDESRSGAEVERLIREELRRVGALSPAEQQVRYKRAVQRIEGLGYDFWVLPVDRSDVEFLRLETVILYARTYNTYEVLEMKVRRSVVEAERLAVDVGVGLVERRVDRTSFTEAREGFLARQPVESQLNSFLVSGAVELPRLRFEGALISGDSLSATADPNLSGDQRDLILGGEVVMKRWGRFGVSAVAGFQDTQETLVEESSNFSTEARGVFEEVNLGLGLVYGTLMNGITLYVGSLDRSLKDESPGVSFRGLPHKLWDETGTLGELRLRRTTNRWELDFRYRREETTREFAEDAFPGFLDANITGSGIRGELVYRPRGRVGFGLIGARSEFEFLDVGEVRPSLREKITGVDSFVGLRLSYRFVPY